MLDVLMSMLSVLARRMDVEAPMYVGRAREYVERTLSRGNPKSLGVVPNLNNL